MLGEIIRIEKNGPLVFTIYQQQQNTVKEIEK